MENSIMNTQEAKRVQSLQALQLFGFIWDSRFFSSALQVLTKSLILQLAFQSIGVVYGDVGTSPLYVFSGIFPNGIGHQSDVLGAMSLVFYTLTIVPLIKYVFIVLYANDNGDGKILRQCISRQSFVVSL